MSTQIINDLCKLSTTAERLAYMEKLYGERARVEYLKLFAITPKLGETLSSFEEWRDKTAGDNYG